MRSQQITWRARARVLAGRGLILPLSLSLSLSLSLGCTGDDTGESSSGSTGASGGPSGSGSEGSSATSSSATSDASTTTTTTTATTASGSSSTTGETTTDETGTSTSEGSTTGPGDCASIVGVTECEALAAVSPDLTLETCQLCQGIACGQEPSCDQEFPCVDGAVLLQGCCADRDCAGLSPYCGMFIATNNICVLDDDV